MNIESFEFALVTAGVGMGIVFFALIVLSVMMLVIRVIFRDRPAEDATHSAVAINMINTTDTAERGEGGIDAGSDPGPDAVDATGLPRWALAGVVTYLVEEERERAPWATPWTTRPMRQ